MPRLLVVLRLTPSVAFEWGIKMKELAILLRAINLYAHSAHNLCGRVPFFQDHEFFLELYEAADAAYDDVIERMIGINGEDSVPSLSEQLQAISSLVGPLPEKGVASNSVYFEILLEKQKMVCAKIEELCKSGLPQGTIQMLGNIADKSEVFQYKIKQRLKK